MQICFRKLFTFILFPLVAAFVVLLLPIFAQHLLPASAGRTVCHALETTPAFIVNGRTVTFTEETGLPYISTSGRTMIPLRSGLNALGCQVEWDQQSQTVITQKGDCRVSIPVGAQKIYVNQQPLSIDTSAVLQNGRTYLPLRAIAESYGYALDWDEKTKTVIATELTPAQINGGTTGIFSRKQLPFNGYDGISADVTLPYVTLAEKGDCPYLYFGFDLPDDKGNVEGGFQFIEDPNNPLYHQWTVFLRQGNEWRWGDSIAIEQGSTHHLEFLIEDSPLSTAEAAKKDLVVKLDGQEVIRHTSSVANFDQASAKTVISMAMLKTFDGTNCQSRSTQAKIAQPKVSTIDSDEYTDFNDHTFYQLWRPDIGKSGTLLGTAECIPTYLHYDEEGYLSIYP